MAGSLSASHSSYGVGGVNYIIAEVRVVPIAFECKSCDLSIKGLDEVMAAGFSHEYQAVDDVDPLEHFSIDPLDHVDVDQIAREYYERADEYQDE